MENKPLFPAPDKRIAEKRGQAAPEQLEAWRGFSKSVFRQGALDVKTKELIAVAVAHVTQCPYCIKAHTRGAMQKGASEKEIMEAIWVAAEMRAGAAVAHSAIAIQEFQE